MLYYMLYDIISSIISFIIIISSSGSSSSSSRRLLLAVEEVGRECPGLGLGSRFVKGGCSGNKV